MRTTKSLLSVVLAAWIARSPVVARLAHSIPEDPYAVPKYRVTYLNGLPVLNETAEKWLREGLSGGQAEFLDQPWKAEHRDRPTSTPREIGSGDEQDTFTIPQSTSLSPPGYGLELMKLGPKMSYICLIPPARDSPPSTEDAQQEPTPAHSWSLLQPLSGTCLYHRQGWFTYSYCHNMHVRQFREMAHSHPHPPGGYRPEEDPEWDAYTLGRAPPVSEPGAELTITEEAAVAANLELARNAGSSYLVQRWGDGTVCDKTGRKREIEIQFHCSMTMTDTVIFVKETKTCHYVMVIHTPRLCGEPGFRSRLEQRDEHFIQCREIVDSLENVDRTLPAADVPFKFPRPHVRPISPPPSTPKGPPHADELSKKTIGSDSIKKALEALLGGGTLKDGDFVIEQLDEGDVVIEIIDTDELLAGSGDREAVTHDHLAQALRAAGFDIKGEKQTSSSKEEEEDEPEDIPSPDEPLDAL